MKKILTIIFTLICTLTYAQSSKTLKDTSFVRGDTIIIPELQFSLSHPMNQNVTDSLKTVIDFLQRHPNFIVEVASHTDSRGSYEGNQKLSELRARHVSEYINHELKTPKYPVSYKGYGESHPIISDAKINKAKTEDEKNKLYLINQRTVLIIKEIK